MRHDDPAGREMRGAAGQFARDVVVAQPVEAVAPHALVVERAGQREGVVHEGMAVKGGVEAGHLRHARKGRHRGADAREVVRLVQRREGRACQDSATIASSSRTAASWSTPPCTTRWPTAPVEPGKQRGALASTVASACPCIAEDRRRRAGAPSASRRRTRRRADPVDEARRQGHVAAFRRRARPSARMTRR
jgi:hypothetical protein